MFDGAEAVLAALTAYPGRIAEAARRLGEKRLDYKPLSEDWSARENLAHLRACADVWGTGIARMLGEDNPAWRYVSPRGYLHKTNYLTLGFGESFAAFAAQRDELLKTLLALSPSGWSRAATINGKQETVLAYADRIASHEGLHVEQIEELLGSA